MLAEHIILVHNAVRTTGDVLAVDAQEVVQYFYQFRAEKWNPIHVLKKLHIKLF